MASVRFIDVQSRPTEFLEFTSLPLDEFHQLVPPFEAAFQAHMAMCRLDRKPPHRSPDCRIQKLDLIGINSRDPVHHRHPGGAHAAGPGGRADLQEWRTGRGYRRQWRDGSTG